MKFDKKIKTKSNKWTFKNNLIVKNFDKHVAKSVPLYSLSHDLTTSLSSFFLKDGSYFYDIGCSTGSLIEKIKKKNKEKKIKYFGIDNSKQMISYAKKKKIKIYNFPFTRCRENKF